MHERSSTRTWHGSRLEAPTVAGGMMVVIAGGMRLRKASMRRREGGGIHRLRASQRHRWILSAPCARSVDKGTAAHDVLRGKACMVPQPSIEARDVELLVLRAGKRITLLLSLLL